LGYRRLDDIKEECAKSRRSLYGVCMVFNCALYAHVSTLEF